MKLFHNNNRTIWTSICTTEHAPSARSTIENTLDVGRNWTWYVFFMPCFVLFLICFNNGNRFSSCNTFLLFISLGIALWTTYTFKLWFKHSGHFEKLIVMLTCTNSALLVLNKLANKQGCLLFSWLQTLQFFRCHWKKTLENERKKTQF